MARCSCGSGLCNCSVTAGEGVTVTGSGSIANPYIVSAGSPPCSVIRPCISATDGVAYNAATGVITADLSSDAGNTIVLGSDSGLYVPTGAATVTVGCGLTGDGTPGTPVAVAPAAGQAAWSASWSCAVAAHSTLKCDPVDGTLWTPPEHFTSADHIYQEHMAPSIPSIGPTGGWTVLAPGGTPAVVSWNVPANFLGNQCRRWSYSAHNHASFDINYDAAATFEVGYVYQEDGGPVQIRPLWGLLTAPGAARRERHAGSIAESGFNRLAGGTLVLNMFPAVNVLTGTIGINSWTSDATIHITTQAT